MIWPNNKFKDGDGEILDILRSAKFRKDRDGVVLTHVAQAHVVLERVNDQHRKHTKKKSCTSGIKYFHCKRASICLDREVNKLQRRDCSLEHCQVLRHLSPK